MNFLPTLPLIVSPLMAFGILLFVGAIGGYIAHRIKWLPSITGFMAVGLLIGPSGIGLFDEKAIQESGILIDIALGLILYRLGLSIDLRYLRQTRWLAYASLAESAATFIAVSFVLVVLETPMALAALIAAIFISSSPAVLLHVSHETGASGSVTDSSKSLVALNNVFSFMAFITVLPFMHHINGANLITIILQPAYRLLGSLFLGMVIAFILHQVALRTHHAPQYKLALVIGSIMLSVGLADELTLSTLVVPLTVGLVIKNLEHETNISDIDFGEPFEILFIILFVYAGAGLHLHELFHFAPAILALVAARILAKMIGVSASALMAQQTIHSAASRGLLLIPMAGLAIGLVQSSNQLFPEHTTIITPLVLGAVAIFETIGPPIAAFAFRLCGEAASETAHFDNRIQSDAPQAARRLP